MIIIWVISYYPNYNAQKLKLFVKKTADRVTFTEEILNGKLHFLCRVRYLILLHSSSYIFNISLLSSVGISAKFLFLYFHCCRQCKNNVLNKNIFEWLFFYLDVIWIRIFYVDHFFEKVVHTIFYINFF